MPTKPYSNYYAPILHDVDAVFGPDFSFPDGQAAGDSLRE